MIDPKLRPYLTFDYENISWMPDESMMGIINAGLKLTIRQEMSKEYFDELVWLLVAQMDSEYVGAYGYMPVAYISPKVAARELESVSRIVHEETKHGDRVRDILSSIGFDADRWIEDHWEKYDWRLGHGQKLTLKRPTSDFRLNIFYYPIVSRDPNLSEERNQLLTLINFGVFQLDQDRGAGEQLRDTLHSSFKPWADANMRTMSEENFHIDHGDKWLAKLFGEYPDLVQQQFDVWWPRVLAAFGRPQSTRNDLWRKFGLKHRTNEEVLREFLDRTEHPAGLQWACKKIGLVVPSTEAAIEAWIRGDHLKFL